MGRQPDEHRSDALLSSSTGGERPVDLVLRDLFAAPDAGAGQRRFGSVVLAEVLEHLENPVAALKGVARHMKPGAFLWLHVPINSPAPDHLYLLRTPEEAVELARSGGFAPTDWAFYPMTGQTLERARKRSLTISAVVTANSRLMPTPHDRPSPTLVSSVGPLAGTVGHSGAA